MKIVVNWCCWNYRDSGEQSYASIAVFSIRHTFDIDINKQMRIRLFGMIKVAVYMNNNFCLRPV